MYARVAVASNALDLGAVLPPIANALHSALVETLLAHGRLVFASNEEALDFVRAIRNTTGIPPAARSRWAAMLVHLKSSGRVLIVEPPGETRLAMVDAIDLLRSGWGGHADVAVVAQALCAALGVPQDTGVLSAPGYNPDVAVAAAASSAPALARIQELWQHPVATHGSAREDFWTTVLGPVATGAVEATVLDGYLFKRVSQIAHGRCRTPVAPEHISWLLERLDRVMAEGGTVRLIGNAAHVESGDDAQAIAQFIHDHWSPLKTGRLAKVEILLGSRLRGGPRFPHDRHIRFSTGSAIKVPAGFDRLSEELIWDTSGMWWTYHWQPTALASLRADEAAATSLVTHHKAFALIR
jgi:hypothetical protein